MICVITYTKNSIIVLTILIINNSVIFNNFSLLAIIFLSLSIHIFYLKLVLSKRNQRDELEKIATPEIFEKFLYAKRMARLTQKQMQYFLRQIKKTLKH